MQSHEVVATLVAALEASVFVAPEEPGLTRAELGEVGARLGLKKGEIDDAMAQVIDSGPRRVGERLITRQNYRVLMGMLNLVQEPEQRNVEAFDFIVNELVERVREDGAVNAKMSRAVLVERGVEQGLPRHDLQVAIAVLLQAGELVLTDGELRFGRTGQPRLRLPSESLRHGDTTKSPVSAGKRVLATPHVEDVVARRADARPLSAEPLDAFVEALGLLGHSRFRAWWVQTVSELRKTDPSSTPIASLILSAALVEGALCLVVVHGRSLDRGVFGSTDFGRESRTWRIDDLINGAARGDAAILDPQTKVRAEMLARTRQRIHAGRLLSETTGSIPDLRPEEARDGRATAELVVRQVLDWLRRFPPASSAT